MTSSFDEAVALTAATGAGAPSERTFRWRIPEGWEQGAGAFGGLVVAALIRAIEQSEPDASRRLRTVTGDLCAPALAGDSEVRVRVLRRGKAMTFLDAVLVQKGTDVVARASGTLGASRDLEPSAIEARGGVRPAATDAISYRPWRDVAVYTMPPGGPAFARHYEVRPTAGLPFARASEALVAGWTREVEPLDRLDAASVAARMDAWWPALFPAESKPRMAATVAFTLVFVADPRRLSPTEPSFRQGRVHSLHDGFFVESRDLWCGEGLVLTSQQTFAVLK